MCHLSLSTHEVKENNNIVIFLSLINILIFLELFDLSNNGPDWEVMPGAVVFMLLFTLVLFILFFVQLKFFLSRKKEPLIWISYITGIIPSAICLTQWISEGTIVDSLRISKFYNEYIQYIYFSIILFLIGNFLILGINTFKKKRKIIIPQ